MDQLPATSPEDGGEPMSDEGIARLLQRYEGTAGFGSRWRNFSLQGSGFSPFVIYGMMAAIVVAWGLLAWLLSLLGPFFALILACGLGAVAWYVSHQQSMREVRVNMGLCPSCGYDLRASVDRCPECGAPIPEQILRWRRARNRSLGAQAAQELQFARVRATPKPALSEPIPFDDSEPESSSPSEGDAGV